MLCLLQVFERLLFTCLAAQETEEGIYEALQRRQPLLCGGLCRPG